VVPLVSVVIPVRNRRDLLVACLDSLAAQTYDRFEVVVVDDGSTDGSDKAAEEHDLGGRPITVVRLGDSGRGAVAARTAGVDAASGDVLAFTDSDCVPAPDWVERGMAAINGGLGVVQGRTESSRPRRPTERSMWVSSDNGLFPTCNVFYRRDEFDRAGGFDPTLAATLGFNVGDRAQGLGMGEDTMLGWRVRRAAGGAYADDVLVRHHVFPPDWADAVSRSLQAGGFPALVREVPELRDTLLTGRVFQGTARIPLYAAAGLLAARRPKLAAVAAGVWAHGHWRHTAATMGGRRRRVAVMPWLLTVDVIEAAALMAGSVRSRSLVL
jgi:glycosyltransferase involved in cell wall biosynthesis